MTRPRTLFTMSLLGICVVGLPSGCQLGPASLRVSHAEYNEAIQRASAEQLLLNLVRLKYREVPMVLDVGSISAQFEISQSLGIAGTFNENVGQAVSGSATQLGVGPDGPSASVGGNSNRLRGRNPDQLALSGQLSYAERPTVTYTPLQGQDFVDRMLTPISLPTVVKLTNSGWHIDRVLSLIVQEMNGLDNVGAASGPTPLLVPEFTDFLDALELMRALQMNRAISLDYETAPMEISSPIPADRVSSESVIQAAAANARFRLSDDGRQAVLIRDVEQPVLHLIEREGSLELVARLRSRLKLSPNQHRYPLVEARGSATKQPIGQDGYTEIVLTTRSLTGVMFYLSQSVESPPEHVRDGLVTQTATRSGDPFDWSMAVGHLLTIHASKLPPMTGELSVRKGSYWFYIRDDDLNSKSTFLLMKQLFSLRAGSARGSTPLLTLPVGG